MLGVGEIFVEFEDIAAATKGRKALAGRKFGGKPVKAVFYPLDLFQVRFPFFLVLPYIYIYFACRFEARGWHGLMRSGNFFWSFLRCYRCSLKKEKHLTVNWHDQTAAMHFSFFLGDPLCIRYDVRVVLADRIVRG